jgi:SAM-dependent methyltransferase
VKIRWHRTKHKVRRRRAALRLLADLAVGRVLDAPCGDGGLAQELARVGHEVWACDLDPDAITVREGVRFDVVDLNGPLPYPDGFFDAAVSLEGVEHLESPAHCLREFARVLRVGGRLILSTPNVNNVQSRLHYFLRGRFSGFRPVTHQRLHGTQRPSHWHITVPYVPTLVFLLRRYGFQLEALEVTMIKTRQWLLLPLALPMWLIGHRASPESLARELASWRLLLGRSVILRATKQA